MVNKQKLESCIKKATTAKLRADNWQYHLDVCDLVRDDPEEAGPYAMELVEGRLKQQDANVILRTLSLTACLAENCGSRLQQSIASKHFTGILFGLVEDKSVHITVKKEVVKIVKQLTKSFERDPSLKGMADLYARINRKYSYLISEPEVPKKKTVNQKEKDVEERELEEALRLSLLEYEQTNAQKSSSLSAFPSAQRNETEFLPEATNTEVQPQALPMRRVKALYDLTASEPDELSFKKGDVIHVIEQVYRDWWRGGLRGKIGIFPLNYVSPCSAPSDAEMAKDAADEQELLDQKPKVDRLLQTLRVSKDEDLPQNQEIGELYSEVTPLRPHITRVLGRVAQKKEDLVSLREILANAELSYNQMLDRAANGYSHQMPTPVNEPPAIHAAPMGATNTPMPANVGNNGPLPPVQRPSMPIQGRPAYPTPQSYLQHSPSEYARR